MGATITYETPDWIYEGDDPALFEPVTAVVTNRAPKQIQQNVQNLKNYINSTPIGNENGIWALETSVNLTGQIQNSSYRKSVIALCKLDNTDPNLSSWSSGSLTFHRDNNANIIDIKADITISKIYNQEIDQIKIKRNNNNTPRACTFTYNNIKYGGVEFYYDDIKSNKVIWDGVGNFIPFGVDYYDTENNVALNSEINNSLNFSEGDIEQGKYWHSGNDGSGSGLDADLLDGNDSSYFAKLNGDSSETFQVADAININDAVNKGQVDQSNMLRADYILNNKDIANMIYDNSDQLIKIQYVNATDSDYQTLQYTDGNLTSINHYINAVLKGTTTLTYSGNDLVSVDFQEA